MRQVMADILGCRILKTSVDQQSASLGAAALAMVALGNWPDFQAVMQAHGGAEEHAPEESRRERVTAMVAAYRSSAAAQAALAPLLAPLRR